ncbi:protein Star-like [Cloeon dipterum]|uniref:protein Star-like n=1 Tax=Cloeon dipterum TaxID=197152 RepID=UPI00322082DD
MFRNGMKGHPALLCTGFIVFIFTTFTVYLARREISQLSHKVAYLNYSITHFDGLMKWKNHINREYVSSFFNAKVPNEVRQWYAYAKSEVEMLNKLPQDSPELIEHIRRNLLVAPRPGKIEHVPKDTSEGQASKILRHFGKKSHGVFIECGASDGLFLSNTFWLESAFNWTGLLIEPEPSSFKKLLGAGRNAWLMPTCLSLSKHPSLKRVRLEEEELASNTSAVHCMPLFSILLAVNQTIDYFSLDTGGNELDILKTVPFHHIDVKVWSINISKNRKDRADLINLMDINGYGLLKFSTDDGDWVKSDLIFSKDAGK